MVMVVMVFNKDERLVRHGQSWSARPLSPSMAYLLIFLSLLDGEKEMKGEGIAGRYIKVRSQGRTLIAGLGRSGVLLAGDECANGTTGTTWMNEIEGDC